jgi:DNA-binding LytR/AlgR family response regulator
MVHSIAATIAGLGNDHRNQEPVMHILIVEDERPTAEDIQLLVRQIMAKTITSIHIETTLENALAYLEEKPVDVLLLDLNLNDKDGFQILKHVVSRSFHTIIISANLNRAVEAFEYGVLDFVPKPYTVERLTAAFNRLQSSHALDGHSMKYFSVKSGSGIRVIPIDDVRYFKAANIYVELHLQDGHTAIYDKPLKQLVPLLPSHYCRVHKSYILNMETIEAIQSPGGGKYRVVLKSGDCLPVSRQQIKTVKHFLGTESASADL